MDFFKDSDLRLKRVLMKISLGGTGTWASLGNDGNNDHISHKLHMDGWCRAICS